MVARKFVALHRNPRPRQRVGNGDQPSAGISPLSGEALGRGPKSLEKESNHVDKHQIIRNVHEILVKVALIALIFRKLLQREHVSSIKAVGAIEASHPTSTAESVGHGRVEKRVATVVEAPGIAEHHEFEGLKAFGRIVATRTIDGKIETAERFFVLSRTMHPAPLLASRREHFGGIENGLHWGLDVAMGEDAARNRMDHGPANIAVLRRRARDLVAADSEKGSLQIKLKRAGWDEAYRLKLLRQMR